MTVTFDAARAKPNAERTALDWLALLSNRLDSAQAEVTTYEDYYAGKHPLLFATSKYREAFGNLFSAFADNWCEIVVDAPVERLHIVGFRFGEAADEDAWKIWQKNALDSMSVVAHTEAGKCGRAYLLVDPNEGEPRITVEHPSQVALARDPGDPRKRLAGIKRWLGEDGFLYANIYLPELIEKFKAEVPTTGLATQPDWKATGDGGTNSLGVVSLVPLENKPGLRSGGQSDLKPAIPLQNAINKLCTDMVVASEYGAFRQRVLTGVEVPRDPETGRPISKAQVESAMSRLWTFENKDAKVYDLPQTDLETFRKAVEMFVMHLAAQTRTPPHYLLGQIVNASGDALVAAEAGLVSKCKSKILFFSDAWEEAMALALQASGRAEVEAAECEALWGDPERTPIDLLAKAATEKQAVGVPRPVLWRELGYTPAQIADMEAYNLAHPPAAQTSAPIMRETVSVPENAPGAVKPAPAAPAAAPPAPPK
jgi:hypothetical protein